MTCMSGTSGLARSCMPLVDGFVKAVDRGWMKILMVDRGLIDGPNIGRLKRDYRVDTVVPLKKNMNAYQDMLGLTRLKDFPWEPYQPPSATRRDQTDRPKHPTLVKRELKRQQTLAKKKVIAYGLAHAGLCWTAAPRSRYRRHGPCSGWHEG